MGKLFNSKNNYKNQIIKKLNHNDVKIVSDKNLIPDLNQILAYVMAKLSCAA